jgi:hypothetical protein
VEVPYLFNSCKMVTVKMVTLKMVTVKMVTVKNKEGMWEVGLLIRFIFNLGN